MSKVTRKKPPKVFANAWTFEPFEAQPDFYQKRMFGGLAAYVHDRMVMVLTEDPGERSYRGKTYTFDIWNGLMLPTEREFHASLMEEFPNLVSHPVLGKWLYLCESDDDFESTARRIGDLIARNDRRFGIYPKIKTGTPAKRTGKSQKK